MADVVINVRTEGGEQSVRTINELKESIRTLEEQASNMDLGSDAYQESISQIEELKRRLQDLGKTREQLAAEEAQRQATAAANAQRASDAVARAEQQRVADAARAVEQQRANAEKIGNNVQKFAAGLTDAFAGAFIAFGASEKDAAKLNATLQQGVGIALGVKGGIEAIVAGIELAGPAFEAFNAIIAANPIAATVIAIAALTAGIYALVKAFETEEKASNAVNDALRRNRQAHIENEKELKKIALEKQLRNKEISQEQYQQALGEISLQDKIKENAAATTKDIVKLYEDYGFNIEKGAKLRQKRADYYTREGVLVQDNAYEAEKRNFDKFQSELSRLKNAALQKTLDDKKVIDAKTVEEIDKFNATELEKTNEKNTKLAEDNQKTQDERNAQALADIESFSKQLQSVIDKNLELGKKESKAALDVERESMLESDDNFYAIRNAKAINAAQNDLIGDEDNLVKKIALLEAQRKEEIRIAQLTNQDVAAINKKYAILEEEAADALLQKKIADANKYVQGVGQALNSIVGAFAAYEALQRQNEEQDSRDRQQKLDSDLTALSDEKDAELAKEGLTNDQKTAINNKYAQQEYELKLVEYNKGTEIKKKAFEQDKKLKIATTVINTITGAVAAFTSLASIPYVGYALGAIAAAAVVATGAIQVSAIEKQKFDAGSPPAAPKFAMPNAAADSSVQGAQQGPSLYSIDGDTDTGGGNGKRMGNTSNEPIRAYVVTEDITTSQNKNAVIERRSSF